MGATLRRYSEATAGALWLAFLTITFQRTGQLLPEKPRVLSPGLLVMLAIGTVLILARQFIIVGESPATAIAAWGLVLGGMVIGSGTRIMAFLLLLLAASVGADTIALLTFLSGLVHPGQSPARDLFAIWELCAAGVACARLTATPRDSAQ